MKITTECHACVKWSQTKDSDNSTHRAWRPPAPDEEGCGTHRELLTADGETKHYGYCPNHGWQPITGKENDRFVHTSKNCKVACHSQKHNLNFTPQNPEP